MYHGLSQIEAAKIFGVDERTFSNWETYNKLPTSRPAFRKFLEILNLEETHNS
ncbi:hypothetical protein D3C76_1662330 [compost metagenome]